MFKFPEAEKVKTEQLSSTLPDRLFTLCLNFQLSPRGHLGDSFGNSEYSRTKRELLSIQSSLKKKKKKNKLNGYFLNNPRPLHTFQGGKKKSRHD